MRSRVMSRQQLGLHVLLSVSFEKLILRLSRPICWCSSFSEIRGSRDGRSIRDASRDTMNQLDDIGLFAP